jgi:uncharacterized phiE125 gp8 family phage protein
MTYRPRNRIWVPAALPASAVRLEDMRAHLRVDSDAEDGLIDDISKAATEVAEKWTQRLLVRREAVLNLPGLPRGLEPVELPGGQVASVTSFVAQGAPVTGAVVYGNSPALLVPSVDWPAVTADGFPVVITYSVGFATVPEDMKAAIKLIATDLYDRRGQSTGQPVNLAAINAEWLMMPHRIRPI